MSPLNNRGPLMGSRVPSAGLRSLPPPRFGNRIASSGMPMRMPPLHPLLPISAFGLGGYRERLPPPPPPLRPGGGLSRPNGMLPLYPSGHRSCGMAPIPPPVRPRGVPHGPFMPWSRKMLSPQMMPPMRPKYTASNDTKIKATITVKKPNKEVIELKKPWMTDEIRNEIQKKNKLYAKAKKSKILADWTEFKDMRNKVTKMIREAKSDYVAKHPEQAHQYPIDEEPYDQRDENSVSTDEETSYCCEICDRDFPTGDALSEHNSTHVTCGIDGCTFTAYSQLVDKHINMQHLTGLYQRMKDLSTPEDIEKWIIERKKKYPTEANINLRKAEELEKSQRGEVIKQRSSNVQMKSKIAHKREKKRRKRLTRAARDAKNIDCTCTDETYRGIRPFRGIISDEENDEECSDNETMQTNLSEKITGYISDEDDIPQASETLKQCDANLPSTSAPVLSTLVADYKSGSESDDGPEEVPVKKIKMKDPRDDKITENIVPKTISSQVCEKSSDRKLRTDADNRSNKKVAAKHDKQKQEINQAAINNKNERIFHKYHNKLLEKLLARDIQHERNVICQCMKYIIQNNFFDSN
ncbi:FMR1-interacting protein NUFIP1 isoform X1 [Linepithema humile]|uniref:FMR1-interacting protein NUFIP1 isoform X1 n=1 Tax=Linepithema humile TaxID=83485 RepID=UPI00351F2A66